MTEQQPWMNELATLRARVEELEQARRSMARRWRNALIAASAVLVSMGGVAVAATGDCPNGLPFCFSANSPARASEVNTNFAQLKEWVDKKLDANGSGSLVTTGNVTAQELHASSAALTAGISASSASFGSVSSGGDLSAPNNLWGSRNRLGPWTRNDCNAHPSGALCPEGQYVCGIYTDHTCGQNWYEAQWYADC